jgi:hypothetical protein
MKKSTLSIGWISLVASLPVIAIAYFSEGFFQNLFIELFGTIFGLAIAIFAVNFYLDKSARKIAAHPLAVLIEASAIM